MGIKHKLCAWIYWCVSFIKPLEGIPPGGPGTSNTPFSPPLPPVWNLRAVVRFPFPNLLFFCLTLLLFLSLSFSTNGPFSFFSFFLLLFSPPNNIIFLCHEGWPGMSDVFPPSGISGLSFDSTFLSPLLFVLLLFLVLSFFYFIFLFFVLLTVHSLDFLPENSQNVFR